MKLIPTLPKAPSSIQKGVPLKNVLNKKAVEQLAYNLHLSHSKLDVKEFVKQTMQELEPLTLKERANHIAKYMRKFLPENYSEALNIILSSLTPPLLKTKDNGLTPMFYMPHCSFISIYGVDAKHNDGIDPFTTSMVAQYELTQRFTCEFSIRSFIENDLNRTIKQLNIWAIDSNPHVRRLCSEGTRPRLPWATKLKELANNPYPILPILELLKNDPDLYVRRSVANHIGDIAKDHMDLALNLCETWLQGANSELKWVIRHALRNPDKNGEKRAKSIRLTAK